MTRPRRKPDKTPESTGWNEVKVLFESLQNSIGTVAEDVRGLRSEFAFFKLALEDVDGRLQRLEPIIQTLAPVPGRLEAIEKRLDSFDERLKVVEAR